MAARFEAKDDGFDLLLGDRVILRHRIDAPAFRIAKGNPTVTMVRGNFRMEDALTDERVPAYVVKVTTEKIVGDADIIDILLAERIGACGNTRSASRSPIAMFRRCNFQACQGITG